MADALNQAKALLEQSFAQFLASLPAILLAILVFYVVYRAAIVLESLVQKSLERLKRRKNLQMILARLARWLLTLTGFLFAVMLAIPSFSPAELLSILGIGSVAIGFAFRDVLQNFLAGILILLTEPFNIGDQIEIGDFEGTIEDIHIRATYIKTYDNRRIVIPNGKLFEDSVTVNTAFDKRRSQYDVGISYSDNIEAAQALCLEVMKSIEGVLDSPEPDTIMMEMADSAIIFRIRWWTNPRMSDVLAVQNRVLRTIKNRLTENGFTIPFPIRTVYLNQSERT